MTLYKYVREWVDKYTFVTHIAFEKAVFRIYYEVDGEECFKRLPYRASQKQLQITIEKIKEEVHYYKLKKIRDIEIHQAVKDDENKKPIIEI